MLDLLAAGPHHVLRDTGVTAWPTSLRVGVAYYSGVWAASGVGSYTYVLVQGTTPTTTTTPGPTTTTAPPPSERPNVVVINTDDMRADMTAALPKIRQWLADGGTTFRNAYISTPSCCPSRASLMSGRYVHNNGQFQQQTLGFNLDLTIQRYLHDAGFLTGHAGKFLHWLDLGVEAPHFDRWTYFKGGYENVSTIRRSPRPSTPPPPSRPTSRTPGTWRPTGRTSRRSSAIRAARQCVGAGCP